MDSEGYLPITLIASFHRVQALSSDVALVLSAVKESDKLEVYKDFKIRTKYDPLKWPMSNVGNEVPPIRPEVEHHPPPTTVIPAFVPVLIQAPPPVSEVLHNIPPPPIIRNSRKNASDSGKREQPAHVAVNAVNMTNNNDDIKVLPPPPIPSSSSTTIQPSSPHQTNNNNNNESKSTTVASDNLNLNPDVSAFVPKSSPKNEVANAVMPPTAVAQKTSEAKTNNSNNNKSTEDANIWKEVKRRSKTSQQQKDITAGSSDHNKKLEKEELDFQFDEEIHFEDDIPQSGGRINNFSEFSDDEESDFELSDRDINKLLIVTQIKTRPPKHEGDYPYAFLLL